MRERLESWRRAFYGSDNAVFPALVNYAWNHAVFMSGVKAVELAPVDTTR